MDCPLQVGGESLTQVENSSMSECCSLVGVERNEIDRGIVAVSALMQILFRSVVVKAHSSGRN